MRDPLQDGMAEATLLTRQGRLAEATAVIQRTLGGAFAPVSPDHPGGADEPTEATFGVADEAPQPTAPSPPEPTEHALRPAPRPPRGFRGMSRLPGAVPEATPGKPTPAVGPSGGRFIERSYRSGRNPRLQAVHPERLYRAGGAPGRHASRLYPDSVRFRRRHPHERARREADLPRRLSRANHDR